MFKRNKAAKHRTSHERLPFECYLLPNVREMSRLTASIHETWNVAAQSSARNIQPFPGLLVGFRESDRMAYVASKTRRKLNVTELKLTEDGVWSFTQYECPLLRDGTVALAGAVERVTQFCDFGMNGQKEWVAPRANGLPSEEPWQVLASESIGPLDSASCNQLADDLERQLNRSQFRTGLGRLSIGGAEAG